MSGLRTAKRRGARYTEELADREEAIAALHRQQLSAGASARRLGMSEEGVCHAIRRMRARGVRLPNYSAELARVREDEVVRRLRGGKTPVQIAADLKFKQGTVYAIVRRLRKRGVELPATEAERRRRRDQRVARLLNEGKSRAEAARALGVTYACILGAVRRLEKRGEPVPAPARTLRRVNSTLKSALQTGY